MCFVVLLVCLYVCVCECLFHINMRMFTSNQYSYIRGQLRECRSIRPGGSGLPHYCTPPVCVPDVLGALAVWQLSTNKKISEVPNPTNAYSVFTNSQLVCQIGSQNQFNKPMPAARRGVYLYKTKKYITCMHL